MSEHEHCLWKPTDTQPCAHPRCRHGVSGFYLIVPVPADTMAFAMGRFGGPRWPDKRYRRERHESEGEVWFSWLEEDLYEDRYGATDPPEAP